MATPNLPRDLIEHLRKLQARLERAERRDPFANTGLSVPSPGEVDMTGLLRVLGELVVSGFAVIDATGGIQSSNYVADVAGWRLDGFTPEFNTPTKGIGTVKETIQTLRVSASNFALTTTFATLATMNAVVPTGFTGLNARLDTQLYDVNPNTTGGTGAIGGDYIYVRALLGGASTSTATPTPILGSNGLATTMSGAVFDLAGLTDGQVIPLAVQGRSGYASIAAYSGNYVSLTAVLTWTR